VFPFAGFFLLPHYMTLEVREARAKCVLVLKQNISYITITKLGEQLFAFSELFRGIIFVMLLGLVFNAPVQCLLFDRIDGISLYIFGKGYFNFWYPVIVPRIVGQLYGVPHGILRVSGLTKKVCKHYFNLLKLGPSQFQ
jgi:hypothetical protein